MKARLSTSVPAAMIHDLKLAGVQQLAWLVLMSLILDGGELFRYSVSGFAGYWLGIVAIALKRLPYKSRSDRVFVRWAPLLLAFLAICIAPLVHHYTHWAFVKTRT